MIIINDKVKEIYTFADGLGCNVLRYGECLKVWPNFVALDTDFTNQWPRYDQRACENYCIEAEKYRRCGCVTNYYGIVLTCGLFYHRPPSDKLN